MCIEPFVFIVVAIIVVEALVMVEVDDVDDVECCPFRVWVRNNITCKPQKIDICT